jgi:uncharacterized membrane protein YdjX (TVP38/TMEM64 family)/rhodanese-related sulfurtransferase
MKTQLIRLAFFVILVAGIALVVMYREYLGADALHAWVEAAGAAAPLLFMLIYILGTVFFLPGSILTLLGGALFGPVMGTFYNLTAATIGAIFAFLIARFLASGWVASKTGGRIKQLINGVENEGWRFVAFVRLVPLFPFNLLNYALGLTKIKFTHYCITTYISMVPAAIAYTYLGYIGKEAATGGEGLVQKTMMALALLAIVAFLPRLIGSFRKGSMISIPDLKGKLDAGEDILLLDVRSTQDFNGEQHHIKGAANIPLNALKQRLGELDDYLERTIVTISRTDRMSAKAAQLLAQHGFADVHVTRQGMTDWNANQYPVE